MSAMSFRLSKTLSAIVVFGCSIVCLPQSAWALCKYRLLNETHTLFRFEIYNYQGTALLIDAFTLGGDGYPHRFNLNRIHCGDSLLVRYNVPNSQNWKSKRFAPKRMNTYSDLYIIKFDLP